MYPPRYDCRSGEIRGAQALLRWSRSRLTPSLIDLEITESELVQDYLFGRPLEAVRVPRIAGARGRACDPAGGLIHACTHTRRHLRDARVPALHTSTGAAKQGDLQLAG